MKTIWNELQEASACDGAYEGCWLRVISPRHTYGAWFACSSLLEGDNASPTREQALGHLTRHLENLRDEVKKAGLL